MRLSALICSLSVFCISLVEPFNFSGPANTEFVEPPSLEAAELQDKGNTAKRDGIYTFRLTEDGEKFFVKLHIKSTHEPIYGQFMPDALDFNVLIKQELYTSKKMTGKPQKIYLSTAKGVLQSRGNAVYSRLRTVLIDENDEVSPVDGMGRTASISNIPKLTFKMGFKNYLVKNTGMLWDDFESDLGRIRSLLMRSYSFDGKYLISNSRGSDRFKHWIATSDLGDPATEQTLKSSYSFDDYQLNDLRWERKITDVKSLIQKELYNDLKTRLPGLKELYPKLKRLEMRYESGESVHAVFEFSGIEGARPQVTMQTTGAFHEYYGEKLQTIVDKRDAIIEREKKEAQAVIDRKNQIIEDARKKMPLSERILLEESAIPNTAFINKIYFGLFEPRQTGSARIDKWESLGFVEYIKATSELYPDLLTNNVTQVDKQVKETDAYGNSGYTDYSWQVEPRYAPVFSGEMGRHLIITGADALGVMFRAAGEDKTLSLPEDVVTFLKIYPPYTPIGIRFKENFLRYAAGQRPIENREIAPAITINKYKQLKLPLKDSQWMTVKEFLALRGKALRLNKRGFEQLNQLKEQGIEGKVLRCTYKAVKGDIDHELFFWFEETPAKYKNLKYSLEDGHAVHTDVGPAVKSPPATLGEAIAVFFGKR